ncbi:MAG: GAF domain-containing protein [Chloroflexi bacterium]|nr:GAF domain-containing protein [Chloroflexota bacterium]
MSNATIISPSSPLKRIVRAVRSIEAGEYIPGFLADIEREPGELGQLAHTIDAMAQEILLRHQQLNLLRKVIPVGVLLSTEKDYNRLLETLVVEAQVFTHADAGTLYLFEDNMLKFVILRNKSLNITMGGTSGNEIAFSPVKLYNADGSENRANVASYAALTHQRVNIADAYEVEGFDFSGTKAFDANTGYRSKSFLTIPLENAEKQVIGVLQLINAIDPKTGGIIPFIYDDVFDALVLLATTALDGYIREASLWQEIAKLRIEIDESKRASQVAEITDSAYFKDLKDKASELRLRQPKDNK